MSIASMTDFVVWLGRWLGFTPKQQRIGKQRGPGVAGGAGGDGLSRQGAKQRGLPQSRASRGRER